VTQFLNKKFIVKNTGKYGKGVFAKMDIKKGEKIHLFKGEKIEIIMNHESIFFISTMLIFCTAKSLTCI